VLHVHLPTRARHRRNMLCCLLLRVLQVLLPVYGSSCLVAVLVHRRGHAVGRCVFKLYGLMPLLLRDHSKSLTLYRCGCGACMRCTRMSWLAGRCKCSSRSAGFYGAQLARFRCWKACACMNAASSRLQLFRSMATHARQLQLPHARFRLSRHGLRHAT
jgi:hypothetical protein